MTWCKADIRDVAAMTRALAKAGRVPEAAENVVAQAYISEGRIPSAPMVADEYGLPRRSATRVCAAVEQYVMMLAGQAAARTPPETPPPGGGGARFLRMTKKRKKQSN
jgi:hypothetical protein